MLNLILGAAGTGKTALLFERISQCVREGRKAILIVPEQSSFESEKALYRRLGAKNALCVEVLSFTRLCDNIFREFGGMAGVYIDTPSKYLLMAVALGEVTDSLQVYQKSSDSASFVSSMCGIISEVKTAGVAPDALHEAARQNDGLFSQKLSDIALIYAAYQAVLERGYNDPDDNLTRALGKVKGTGFFSDYEIFIDGFTAFMGAEWALLGEMIEQSAGVTAALTCGSLDDHRGIGAFSAPSKTAMRMIDLARKCGQPVAAPVTLREPMRYKASALAHLSRTFGAPVRTNSDAGSDGIALTACEDVYDELDYIARTIVSLVRDEGYRYREIALISRTLDAYLVPLQVVFAKYGIPYFADMRADIGVHPFISGLLCALDAVRGNFDTDSLIRLSKICITGIDPVDAGLLENYCFTWSVSGFAWTRDFAENPAGMQGEMTPEQSEQLFRINRVREAIVTPIIKLRKSLADCDGEGFAAALFDYLEQCGAVRHLQEEADGMPQMQAKRFLEDSAQVWDILMGLLDAFASVLGGYSLPLAKYIDLFRISVSAADIGAVPQTLDQVIVGMADRIRPDSPRAVFTMGLNEGEFPRYSAPSNILSGQERDRLHGLGIDLLRTPEQQMLLERYYVYFALTQASERLFLSYPQRDAGGAALAPSSPVTQVQQMFSLSECYTIGQNAIEAVVNPATLLDMLSRLWMQDSSESAALRDIAQQVYSPQYAALEACAQKRPFVIEDEAVARALFGEDMHLSPSRVDRYYSCPFLYFCKDGLRLRAQRKVEFSPLESGEVIHLVLEELLSKYGGKGLAEVDDDDLQEEISAIIQADLSSRIADVEKMPMRFRYLFRRLVGTIFRMVKRLALEFAQSEFEPVGFEMPVARHGEIMPLDLQAPDGTRVIVEGVIDRVDTCERDGVRYIRVVDYKSGAKEFALSDVYYGLNMQMLIYLFAACEDGRFGEQAAPAGVLYMPAKDAVIATQRDTTAKELQAQQIKRLRMNGLLLADETALKAMEPELQGVFIPVKAKKDGSIDGSRHLATLAELGEIRRHVERRLVEIASLLHSGNIDALPIRRSGKDDTPCKWCDYRSVCTHEEDDDVRCLAELDRTRAIHMMREEGGGADA